MPKSTMGKGFHGRHCRVHFYAFEEQPLSKQLYTSIKLKVCLFFFLDSLSVMSEKCARDSRSQRNAAIVILFNSYLVDKE